MSKLIFNIDIKMTHHSTILLIVNNIKYVYIHTSSKNSSTFLCIYSIHLIWKYILNECFVNTIVFVLSV